MPFQCPSHQSQHLSQLPEVMLNDTVSSFHIMGYVEARPSPQALSRVLPVSRVVGADSFTLWEKSAPGSNSEKNFQFAFASCGLRWESEAHSNLPDLPHPACARRCFPALFQVPQPSTFSSEELRTEKNTCLTVSTQMHDSYIFFKRLKVLSFGALLFLISGVHA